MKRRRARRETADGDGDGDTTVSDAVALAAILGLVVAIVLAVAAAPAVAKFAGPRSASIVPAALTYASIRCLGVPFALVASVAQASFLACRRVVRGREREHRHGSTDTRHARAPHMCWFG